MNQVTVTVAALMLVLVAAVSEASIYRASFNGEMGKPQDCQSEIQQVSLRSCRKYVRSGGQPGLFLPTTPNQGERPSQECCDNLESLSRECRCEAARRVLEQEGGSQGEREQSEMEERAQQLPSRCGLNPDYCQVRGVYSWYNRG